MSYKKLNDSNMDIEEIISSADGVMYSAKENKNTDNSLFEINYTYL